MSERRTFPKAPTEAKVLLIEAHPLEQSFNSALAKRYREALEQEGLRVERLRIQDMDFNPRLEQGYQAEQVLEASLKDAQRAIAEAAHLVFAYPLWWGSTPAMLKAFFDRCFLPGWAFAYDERGYPKGGLAGRSGRILITMDAPQWYDSLFYRASARQQVKKATLKFCGLKPVEISTFSSIRNSTPQKREAMLERAFKAGQKDARRILKRFASSGTVATVSRAS